MAEYIEKQAAIKAFENKAHLEWGYLRIAIPLLKTLEAIPAADVAQVVRCEDCKYYGSRRWCELHSSVFDDNAFCSYGERREE